MDAIQNLLQLLEWTRQFQYEALRLIYTIEIPNLNHQRITVQTNVSNLNVTTFIQLSHRINLIGLSLFSFRHQEDLTRFQSSRQDGGYWYYIPSNIGTPGSVA